MAMLKRILAFTAIRSEYDLMSPLFKLLDQDKSIDLKLIVSGAHLSQKYGLSLKEIEADGFGILKKIETLDDSDFRPLRIKSAARLLNGAIDHVLAFNPDMILYAGDREETIMASLMGGYLEIPTIHFYGGDHVKDSHIDNPVRHATSKLSSIHMVSTIEHKRRLVAMGESPERIFVIGSIALDRFVAHKCPNKGSIKKHFGIQQARLFDQFALVIFHTIPLERDKSGQIFNNILIALKKKSINAFVIYPNIDPGSDHIIKKIELHLHDKNFIFCKNVERDIFLSIYKNASFIIGNSSSGILEAASVPIPAVNVGLRQSGRAAPANVFFSGTEPEEIIDAIDNVMGEPFQSNLQGLENPYGDGHSASRAYELIKNNDFKKFLFKNEDPLEKTNGLL